MSYSLTLEYRAREPGALIADALDAVSDIPQIEKLPRRNRDLILAMTARMINVANETTIGNANGATWRSHYWGLYLIGSRARGEENRRSDVDLLSLGTLGPDLGFPARSADDVVFIGFRTRRPSVLPTEYNGVGNRYMIQAKSFGVRPVDLCVVDRTYQSGSLEAFLNHSDLDSNGKPFPARIPLVEIATPMANH